MSPPAKINKFVDDIHNKRKDFNATKKKQIWTIFRSELSISPIPPPLVSPTEQKDKKNKNTISSKINFTMLQSASISKL